MKKLAPIITIIFLFLTGSQVAQAQEFALVIQPPPPGITVTTITDGELDFGRVVQNQGTVRIRLQDAETEVIRIERSYQSSDWRIFFEWWYNRNITVTVTADNNLRKGISASTIPFTVSSAYDNQGETENKQQAQTFTSSTQFDMPGPWQEPPENVSTVFVYIYGDITVGNNVEAGDYTGTITIDVTD
jgi:hypothetical protein